MQPLSVSSVIPTCNRKNLVLRAIRTAEREIDPNDEVIVVDDGSTDGTGAAIAALQDLGPRYIPQAHQGAGVARNPGAGEAKCDLVAFLDSHDEWLAGKIQLQRARMKACPEVLFYFTDFLRIHDGQRHARSIRAWHTSHNSKRVYPRKKLPGAASIDAMLAHWMPAGNATTWSEFANKMASTS